MSMLVYYKQYLQFIGEKFPLSRHRKESNVPLECVPADFSVEITGPNVWVTDFNFVMAVYMALGLAHRQWERVEDTTSAVL